MRYLVSALIVFLVFFLQGRISVLGIAPELTTLLPYYAGIRYGETRGLLTGVIVGALQDSVSVSLLGPHLLSKGIVGFFSSFFISGGVLRWTPFLGILAISLLTFIDNVIVFSAKSIFDVMPALPSEAVLIAIMQAILNAPAGICVRPKHAD